MDIPLVFLLGLLIRVVVPFIVLIVLGTLIQKRNLSLR